MAELGPFKNKDGIQLRNSTLYLNRNGRLFSMPIQARRGLVSEAHPAGWLEADSDYAAGLARAGWEADSDYAVDPCRMGRLGLRR